MQSIELAKSQYWLKVGNLYTVNGKDGYCYFYDSYHTPYTVVRIENGTLVLYLGEKYKTRNEPFSEQFVYEFLFDNRRLYLLKTTSLLEVSV